MGQSSEADTTKTDTCSIEKPLVQRQPTTGIIFLDASGSMKGYLQSEKEPRFIGAISLMYKLIPQLKASLHGISPDADTLECSEFLDKLNKRDIKWKPESEMHRMISTLMSSTDDIAMLVTDGIMSGTTAQTDPNQGGKKTYSIDNRQSMQNTIWNIVKPKAKTNAILIIRALSNFTGNYYPYYNIPAKYISDQQRPFFIICTGKKEYVKWVYQQLMQEPDAASWQLLFLGESYQGSFNCKYGTGLKLQSGKVKYESRKTDTFKLEFDIDSLPEYMKTTSYLSQNLTFSYNRMGQPATTLDTDKYTMNIDSHNHQVEVEISRISLVEDGGQLHYNLDYRLPSWVEDSSTDDDSAIPDSLCRTFNLKYLINGLVAVGNTDYVAKGTIEFIK